MKLLRILIILFISLLIAACSPSRPFSKENLLKIAKQEVRDKVLRYCDEVQFEKIQEIKYFERNATGTSNYVRDRAFGIAVLKSKTP